MGWQRRLAIGWKALTQLGIEQVGLYALYRFGLASGHYRRATPGPRGGEGAGNTARLLDAEALASRLREFYRQYPSEAADILAEADEALAGKARLFGGDAVAVDLRTPAPPRHWTEYERGRAQTGVEDIKFVWEPARFGWALALARGYVLSGNIDYAQSFWAQTRAFLEANPPYLGPNWTSGQEAGVRLMAMGLAAQALRAGASEGDEARLAEAIAAHAERIPPTLVYARAQHNNHLLTEAAGLLTAAALLPEHRRARRWRELGWKWLNHGLQTQIAADGTYAQQSSNYHRLMLQTALWGQVAAGKLGLEYPAETQVRLAAATRWLAKIVDGDSGRAANLGSNDGAYILPLAPGGFEDYRPTLQAAGHAFVGQAFFGPGAWDEMQLWFGDLEMGQPGRRPTQQRDSQVGTGSQERLEGEDGWAMLRAARFSSRPGHADQMQVDIWRRGRAVTLDAGTYRYTAAAPWQNALASARVHNTVTVDEQEPMLRAGKFLWLDWDQARWIETGPAALEAEHDGWWRLGVTHRRRLEADGAGGWRVIDRLLPAGAGGMVHRFILHWLLPDGEWALDGTTLRLTGPEGSVRVAVSAGGRSEAQLIRGGAALLGAPGDCATLGWFSPTYNHKVPALSFRVVVTGVPPLVIETVFRFEG